MDNSQPEDRSLKCKYITVQEAKMLADLLFVPVLFVLMLSPFLVLFSVLPWHWCLFPKLRLLSCFAHPAICALFKNNKMARTNQEVMLKKIYNCRVSKGCMKFCQNLLFGRPLIVVHGQPFAHPFYLRSLGAL